MSEQLKPLAPYEEAKPYSKYYYREITQPNPKLMGILSKGPMDPDKALPLSEMNQLLDPGYHEVETGYCISKDGLGYIAVNSELPGCTVDMLRWWFIWHAAAGNLRYKIWSPLCHYAIAIADQDRRKIVDPRVPLRDKYTDMDHFVVENVGNGTENIVIRFKKHENMGFDTEKFRSSPTVEIIGGYGANESRDNPTGFKGSAVMIHSVREISGGIELRTRFWLGARIIEGKAYKVIPPFVRIPVEAPMGLAFHNIAEFSHLAAVLPELYGEFKNKPFAED